jgi:hypothetical protein
LGIDKLRLAQLAFDEAVDKGSRGARDGLGQPLEPLGLANLIANVCLSYRVKIQKRQAPEIVKINMLLNRSPCFTLEENLGT